MGSWGGRFISAEVVLLKERVVPKFFSATCKDVDAQGLVLRHSLHSRVLTPQLQTKPSWSVSHSPCVGAGVAMQTHRLHTSLQNLPTE